MRTSLPRSFTWPVLLALALLGLPSATAFAQGTLTPPGAPAPTMKSLDQIEARTPISSAPYTISIPGSYYLTTNLVSLSTNNYASGITITANNVTLDLNGFSIINSPTNTPGISQGAIYAPVAVTNVNIRNGQTVNWNSGLNLFNVTGGAIQNLSCLGGSGIISGSGVLVTHCTASFCSNNGFAAVGPGCIFDRCLSYSNSFGFSCYSSNTTFRACQAVGSTGIGFEMLFSNPGVNSGNSLLDGCAAYNCGTGFFLATNGVIQNCIASDCPVGIFARNNCLVKNNQCTDSSFSGYSIAGAGNRVEDNSSVNESAGTGFNVTGTGNFIVKNTSRGGSASFTIAAGNSSGPVVDVWNGGAGTNNITSSPWANFGY